MSTQSKRSPTLLSLYRQLKQLSLGRVRKREDKQYNIAMLNIKNLSIRYRSTGQLAVKDVSFDLGEGRILAILGPSGCGKTTILNAISGLLSRTEATMEGEIVVENEAGKPKMTTVFQEPRLLPWRTVLQNVAYGLEAKKESKNEAREKSKGVIASVQLQKFENYYPSQLSLGMQQRVNLARALVCNPDILFLDEPFSALDIETKANVQAVFKKILTKKKVTTVFVTHNIKEASALADQIIVLSKGPASVENILDKKKLNEIPKEALNYFESFDE